MNIPIWTIYCATGCSCCHSDNHYRGPYRTKEDAERRIAYYHAPDSKFWPVSSQFARRGWYTIEQAELEPISGNRFILNGERVLDHLTFVEVNPDGTVADDKAEWFHEALY